MKDEVVVVCGPIWTSVLPGSKILKCFKCGEDCACSPVGQKVIDGEGGNPYCVKCGLARINEIETNNGTIDLMDPTEAMKVADDFLNNQKHN